MGEAKGVSHFVDERGEERAILRPHYACQFHLDHATAGIGRSVERLTAALEAVRDGPKTTCGLD